MTPQTTVYLVDDDDDVRKTLARALKHTGYSVDAFNCGQAFLDDIDIETYGCVILDVAMPGMSGLEVQTELSAKSSMMPVIFMTGHGDVPTSVRALKNGAIEFLEKPFAVDLLLKRVQEALTIEDHRQSQDDSKRAIMVRFESLTKREADVMASLTAGLADQSNKEVARELKISHRTVEEYRSRIMRKMNASSITHLVEMSKTCGVYRR